MSLNSPEFRSEVWRLRLRQLMMRRSLATAPATQVAFATKRPDETIRETHQPKTLESRLAVRVKAHQRGNHQRPLRGCQQLGACAAKWPCNTHPDHSPSVFRLSDQPTSPASCIVRLLQRRIPRQGYFVWQVDQSTGPLRFRVRPPNRLSNLGTRYARRRRAAPEAKLVEPGDALLATMSGTARHKTLAVDCRRRYEQQRQAQHCDSPR